MQPANSFLMRVGFSLAVACGLAAQQPPPDTVNSPKESTASVPAPTVSACSQPANGGLGTLADLARQQRTKSSGTPTAGGGQPSGQPQKSLADIAAERRVTQPVRHSLQDDKPRKGKARTSHRKKRDPFQQRVSATR